MDIRTRKGSVRVQRAETKYVYTTPPLSSSREHTFPTISGIAASSGIASQLAIDDQDLGVYDVEEIFELGCAHYAVIVGPNTGIPIHSIQPSAGLESAMCDREGVEQVPLRRMDGMIDLRSGIVEGADICETASSITSPSSRPSTPRSRYNPGPAVRSIIQIPRRTDSANHRKSSTQASARTSAPAHADWHYSVKRASLLLLETAQSSLIDAGAQQSLARTGLYNDGNAAIRKHNGNETSKRTKRWAL